MQVSSRISAIVFCCTAILVLPAMVSPAQEPPGNRPERLEWFRDAGLGMFIHWSMDGQLGVVISHSMPGASDDYLKRYVEELPKTFNPEKFNPKAWARLAKLAGMKYVMFTTKHHSGFCMFDTATTDFNVMHTPFKRDVVAEVVKAFRDEGLAIGLYFSVDDFYWLYKHGKVIDRRPELSPFQQPELLAYAKAQMKELFTKFGPIDLMFFDGHAEGLREYAWELNPNVIITSGAMRVTEQHIPGIASKEPFEAPFTMGQEWQYRPTNDPYKSGTQMIGMLIETRAKGGNLLLNMGPTPDGEIPMEQENRFRELALWTFINHEAIYNVRPWILTNEGDCWFTKKKDEDTVYVAVREEWKYAQWRDLLLASVRATPASQVSVLGQNDRVLEYQTKLIPQTTWKQESDGLHIHAMRPATLHERRLAKPASPENHEGAARADAAARHHAAFAMGPRETVRHFRGRVAGHGRCAFARSRVRVPVAERTGYERAHAPLDCDRVSEAIGNGRFLRHRHRP